MGLSVAIAGGIVMITITLVMLTIPNVVSNIFSIGEVSSQSSKINDSVSKTTIKVNEIITKVGSPRVNFTLTNIGSTTLWDYNNFNVLTEYTGAVSGKRTEPLSLWSANPNGRCLGVVPPAGQWCIQSISNDVANPNLINSNEKATIWTRLVENLANSVAVVTAGTDNGVIFTTADNSTSLTTYILTANLTNTNNAAYVTVFTIPLTANSGNTVTVVLDAMSSAVGNGFQARGRTTDTGSNGYCSFLSPTAVGATSIDNLVVSTAPPADTIETVAIAANAPYPVRAHCAIKTGATPGSLIIEFQPELLASTATVKAGSYAIKSP